MILDHVIGGGLFLWQCSAAQKARTSTVIGKCGNAQKHEQTIAENEDSGFHPLMESYIARIAQDIWLTCPYPENVSCVHLLLKV
jgi:hypothetical protein